MSKFECGSVAHYDVGAWQQPDGTCRMPSTVGVRPTYEAGTTICVHCSAPFPMVRFEKDAAATKNRIGRGFCMNCNGFYCGPTCRECVPWERMLEIAEGTCNPTAVTVNVPRPQGRLLLPFFPEKIKA